MSIGYNKYHYGTQSRYTLKKKLLSPLELKKFRAEQEEARKLRAEQLEKKNKKLSAPKELLDPIPVVEVAEEPVVDVVKEPIELLQERVEEFSTQYNEELAQLEVRLANKLELDDVNLQPIQNNICLLYTSPSPRDRTRSRMPSSA